MFRSVVWIVVSNKLCGGTGKKNRGNKSQLFVLMASPARLLYRFPFYVMWLCLPVHCLSKPVVRLWLL